jgi:hypothetical protein
MIDQLKKNFLFLIPFGVAVLTLVYSQKMIHQPQLQDYKTPPLRIIEKMSVGFQFQIASQQWVNFLQSSDYCSEKLADTQCENNSWIYQIIDFATELDPAFEPDMYRAAGLALSILINDKLGAAKIFEKAVVNHPTYWPILYSAGYHAQFEEKNFIKASRYYFAAAENGAPAWLRVLAGRLAADQGDIQFSQKILQMMISENQDEKLIKRLKEKIIEVQAL